MFCVLHKKSVDPSHPRTFQLVLWMRSMKVNVWFSGWCVGSVKRHAHQFLLTKFRLLVTQKCRSACELLCNVWCGVRNKRACKNRGGRRIDAVELQCGKSRIQSVRISVPCFFSVSLNLTIAVNHCRTRSVHREPDPALHSGQANGRFAGAEELLAAQHQNYIKQGE